MHPEDKHLYICSVWELTEDHQNGTDGEKLMTVYRYFTESDPFDELFRVFQTFRCLWAFISSSFDSFRESIGLDVDPFVRINDLDRFSDQLGVKCKSTIQSGQWYRLE